MQVRISRLVRVAGTASAAAALVVGAAAAGGASAVASTSHTPSWLTASHGAQYFPTRATKANNASIFATGSGQLAYGGGNDGIGVTYGHEKVYLVFWGSQWGTASTGSDGYQHYTGDPQGVAPRLQAFFKGVGTNNELWSGVDTQYCEGVSSGATSCPSSNTYHVGYPTGGAFSGVWEDTSTSAPSAASGHQIGVEAVNAAAHFGNTTASANRMAQYVIVSPTGTNPDNYKTQGFCAWHDWNGDSSLSGGAVSSSYGDIAFTNLPYIPDAGTGCGQNYVNSNGTLDGVTIVEGHEYSETVTDQNPAGGWTDSTGYENADKCAWNGTGGTGGAQNIAFSTGSFPVQANWSNSTAACAITGPIIGNGGGTTNDFSMSVSPSSGSVTAGGSTSATVSTSTTSGSAQTVSFSASGLPSGASASFSPSSVTSGSSSTMTISTSSSTASGTYSITITGTGSSATHTASYSLTVGSGGGGGCTARQLLGNPGFETGSASPWSATSGVISATSSSEPSHSGSYLAWLDGYGTTHTDTLSQSVSIPSGCTSATLGFYLHIDTVDYPYAAYDTLQVQVIHGGTTTTLHTYSNLDAASGYQFRSFSLSSYIGQTVTVKFVGTEDSSYYTDFTIDDTSLNVS